MRSSSFPPDEEDDFELDDDFDEEEELDEPVEDDELDDEDEEEEDDDELLELDDELELLDDELELDDPPALEELEPPALDDDDPEPGGSAGPIGFSAPHAARNPPAASAAPVDRSFRNSRRRFCSGRSPSGSGDGVFGRC